MCSPESDLMNAEWAQFILFIELLWAALGGLAALLCTFYLCVDHLFQCSLNIRRELIWSLWWSFPSLNWCWFRFHSRKRLEFSIHAKLLVFWRSSMTLKMFSSTLLLLFSLNFTCFHFISIARKTFSCTWIDCVCTLTRRSQLCLSAHSAEYEKARLI